MLRDGRYAAWFRTPRGQGTGMVNLTKGSIFGRDGFFTYSGSYQIEGERFSAVLSVERHAEGAPGLFGPDKVEISLAGACNGSVATCSGAAREVPDVAFEATLIYSQEEPSSPGNRHSAPRFNSGDSLTEDGWPVASASPARLKASSS